MDCPDKGYKHLFLDTGKKILEVKIAQIFREN